MPRTRAGCALSTLLFLILSLFGAGRAAAQTVTLHTGEWAPYTSQGLPGQGVATEVVTKAYRAVGWDVAYEWMGWGRIQGLVEGGDVYGSFPWGYSEERDAKADFSEPILFSKTKFFYAKERLGADYDFKDLAEIKRKGLRVGGLKGYSSSKKLESEGFTVDYTRSAELSYKKLLAGRIELFPEDELVGWGLLRELYGDKAAALFGSTGNSLTEATMHIMYAPNFPRAAEYTEKFNEGLQILKDTGDYAALFAKYGIDVSN